MPKEILYVDTCVVIEATRTGCWNAIAGHFGIRTVPEVSKELATRPDTIHGYVEIDIESFACQTLIEEPSARAVLDALSRSLLVNDLDAGEKELLAHVYGLGGSGWLVTTGDKAAVRVACALGLADRLISLQEVAEKCGQSPVVNSWYTKQWLSHQKIAHLLDMI